MSEKYKLHYKDSEKVLLVPLSEWAQGKREMMHRLSSRQEVCALELDSLCKAQLLSRRWNGMMCNRS